jgi:hypothetical protein
MNMLFRLVGPLALGWGLSQLLDPSRGRRRRAVIRDKAVRAAHVVGDAVDTTSRDVTNRTRGVVADLRSRLTRDHADDQVIAERVRAALGTCVRHPRAIDVTVRDGRVTLHGPVLADEVPTLLARVAAVRGVRDVDHRLEVHGSPDGVPGLQGGRQQWRGGERFELFQRHWSRADLRRALDEDLVRFKSLLEDGKTTVRGQTVSREALG